MGFSKAEIENRINRKIEYVGNTYGNNLKEVILDILSFFIGNTMFGRKSNVIYILSICYSTFFHFFCNFVK